VVVKNVIFVFAVLLSAGLLLAGCVATPPNVSPTPTVYPTASPTVFPTASPTAVVCTADAKLCPDGSYVGRVPPSCEFTQCPATSPAPGFPEKAKNPLNLSQIEINATGEEYSIRMLSPTSFELTASLFASTPCAETVAYWNSGFEEIRIYFEHAQPAGIYCPQVLKLRTYRTTADYSSVVRLRPFKKVQVYNFGQVVWEKNFEGMFCGGIAAFQCPYAFDCKLDGDYPDAGGKCVFNASVFSGPRPA